MRVGKTASGVLGSTIAFCALSCGFLFPPQATIYLDQQMGHTKTQQWPPVTIHGRIQGLAGTVQRGLTYAHPWLRMSPPHYSLIACAPIRVAGVGNLSIPAAEGGGLPCCTTMLSSACCGKGLMPVVWDPLYCPFGILEEVVPDRAHLGWRDCVLVSWISCGWLSGSQCLCCVIGVMHFKDCSHFWVKQWDCAEKWQRWMWFSSQKALALHQMNLNTNLSFYMAYKDAAWRSIEIDSAFAVYFRRTPPFLHIF